MSVTTTPKTFSDLYTDLQNRVRVQTGVTATQQQAQRYINTALQDMHIGFGDKFWWSEREEVLRTQPKYETGTVTITKGSATLAGSGTAWNTNNSFGVANMRAGGKVVIGGGQDVYEVSAVSSDTSATLTTAFIDDDVSAQSYVYFEEDYELDADFLRPIDWQSFSDAYEIPLLSRTEFRRLFPRRNISGRPVAAAMITDDPSGDVNLRRRIRLWKPPDQAYLIPYAFVTNKLVVASDGTRQTDFTADTDEPIVPVQYRHAIVLHALAEWYRDKKDDDRSQEVRTIYEDLVRRIVGDSEIGTPRPHIQPRVAHYRNQASRPWNRGIPGRFTTGSRFDELR